MIVIVKLVVGSPSLSSCPLSCLSPSLSLSSLSPLPSFLLSHHCPSHCVTLIVSTLGRVVVVMVAVIVIVMEVVEVVTAAVVVVMKVEVEVMGC